MTDTDQFLARIAAGDAEAFASWLALVEDRVRASLESFAGVVDTEAVLQEAFLRVWQVADRVQADGKGHSLLRFAVRVARNHAIDQVRRERRVRPMEVEALTRLADAEVAPPARPDPMLRRLIALCREALPRRPAQALAARLESGGARSDRDLAADVGMRLNTFLQNIGRARRLLITCLGRKGAELPEGLS